VSIINPPQNMGKGYPDKNQHLVVSVKEEK